MILARVRDLAARKPIAAADMPAAKERLQRSLGLFPYPPRTELSVVDRDPATVSGVTVEKVVLESRPGLAVPVLVYKAAQPGPLIVILADILPGGKANPALQAQGVSFAKQGFTVVAIEPPGQWHEALVTERNATGDAREPSLRMALPALGQYVWDVMRTLDWALARDDVKRDSVGICGLGLGAEAALLAYALDERITACALACAAGSLESTIRVSSTWSSLPGIAFAGDFADIAGLRSAPLLLMSCAEDPLNTPEGVQKTADKLRKYKGAKVRTESFVGPVDFNRRMRETAAAFFLEHLTAAKNAPYAYEPIPLTDGLIRSIPAGTVPPEELAVLGDSLDSSHIYGGSAPETFLNLLQSALASPYPTDDPELTPWGKYGRLEGPKPAETYSITDGDPVGGAIGLPVKDVDSALLNALGLSPAEFFAEVLHLLLPGAPEGWEPVGLSGDALTAMIASMRTLVGKGDPSIVTRELNADGPTSSLVAAALARWRPGLSVKTSHTFTSWMEAAAGAPVGGLQPAARYREWR